MRSSLRAGACALAVVVLPIAGQAEADPCSLGIHRANVAACALRWSPTLQAELATRDAAVGRREAARPFLPANPVVSGSIASRRADIARDTNWAVSIGQQIEVGGQRGLRIAAAERELAARGHQVLAARMQVTSEAFRGYFVVLGMRERVDLARRLEAATNDVAGTVRAMAAGGVASEVDADIADAAAIGVTQERLRLEAALEAARAELAIHVGGFVNAVDGELEPIKGVEAPEIVPVRPELLALDEEHTALESRV
ncbi:MAG TPA: TolC family protein, partial [Myxococcota bacterium]|nr:TolC family protein [Myxococcota bacterium]